MKRLWVLFFVCLYFNSFAQQASPAAPKITTDSFFKAKELQNAQLAGKRFPLFSAVYQNKNFNNRNLAGKVVFINFWFATCAPCLAEFGELNRLYDSLKDNKNFEFISFTYEKQDQINEIVKQYKMQYKIVSIDQKDCYRLNQNNGFPTSIIIDANGIIKYLRTGGYTQEEFVDKTVFNLFYPKLIEELKGSHL